MEVHVRSARLTDLDAAVRLLAQNQLAYGQSAQGQSAEGEPDERDGRRDAADYLRNLLFVPSATVVVAETERRVVGVGVLAIRPSVRSGPFVGMIDEIGTAQPPLLDAADGRRVADEIVEHLATSARNKLHRCATRAPTPGLPMGSTTRLRRAGHITSNRRRAQP